MTAQPNRRRLLLLAGLSALAAPWLPGCGPTTAKAAQAVDFDPRTACDLDGMLLADYPGPKGQVHYAGQERPEFFCDTVELFSALLMPEQARAVRAAFVQDMARADWNAPRGHWIDAKAALYVVGSRRAGSMGPTFASFAQEGDAQGFVREWGGRVLRFAEVKPDMADLSGGALHDQKM